MRLSWPRRSRSWPWHPEVVAQAAKVLGTLAKISPVAVEVVVTVAKVTATLAEKGEDAVTAT